MPPRQHITPKHCAARSRQARYTACNARHDTALTADEQQPSTQAAAVPGTLYRRASPHVTRQAPPPAIKAHLKSHRRQRWPTRNVTHSSRTICQKGAILDEHWSVHQAAAHPDDPVPGHYQTSALLSPRQHCHERLTNPSAQQAPALQSAKEHDSNATVPGSVLQMPSRDQAAVFS